MRVGRGALIVAVMLGLAGCGPGGGTSPTSPGGTPSSSPSTAIGALSPTTETPTAVPPTTAAPSPTAVATQDSPTSSSPGCWSIPAYPGARDATTDDIAEPFVATIAAAHLAVGEQEGEAHLWVTPDPYERVLAFYASAMAAFFPWMTEESAPNPSPPLGFEVVNAWMRDDRGEEQVFVWTIVDRDQTVIAMACIMD